MLKYISGGPKIMARESEFEEENNECGEDNAVHAAQVDNKFKPTKAMQSAKNRLHRYADVQSLRTLLPNNPFLAEWIKPTTMKVLTSWISAHPDDFWEWFVTARNETATNTAYEQLESLLALPHLFEDGSVNKEVVALKLKAAELLIKRDKGISVNVLNNQAPPPKGLKNVSPHVLEEKTNRMKLLGTNTKYNEDELI